MDGWMNGSIADGCRAWMDRWIVIDEKRQWIHEVMDEQRATKKEVGGSCDSLNSGLGGNPEAKS